MAYQDTSKHEETRKRYWPSIQQNALFEREEIVNNDVNFPRREYGDLYCVVCDAQMDTEIMWGNHIKGNRHFQNSQNYKYSNEEPIVQKELDRETRPIAGLDHICEILCIDELTYYQCLLCPAGLSSSMMLMEHLMGLKHQMAFLKEHVKEKFALVNSSALSKSDLKSVVQNIIAKYEQEHGRGKMFLMKAKKRQRYYFPYKKNYEDDDKRPFSKSYNYYPPPKSFRYSPSKSARKKEQLSESEWKPIPFHGEAPRNKFSYVDKPYYSDAEKYKSVELKSTNYRRESSQLEIKKSRLVSDNIYNPACPSRYERKNCKDLREVLELKKNLATTLNARKENMDVSGSASFLSEIDDNSDILSCFVEGASPELFLRLASSKLDKIDVKEGEELKLLDLVINKATALALKVKKKILAQHLKAKYKETLAQNGIISEDHNMVDISSQSDMQFTQKLDNLIGHYKARKTTVYEDVCFEGSYTSHLKSSEQCIVTKPMSHAHLNSASPYQSTPEISIIYDSEWNRRQSNSSPCHSRSSTPTFIPGLTLTEESLEQPSTSTVMS